MAVPEKVAKLPMLELGCGHRPELAGVGLG